VRKEEEDMGDIVRVGTLLSVLLFLMVGCATKGWVQEVVGTKETQIGQRIDKLEGKVGEETQRIGKVEVRVGEDAQRIEGMGFQMKALETSVGEAGEVAKGARQRADTALTKVDDVNSRLTTLWANRHTRSPVETLDVQFRFDRWDLSDSAQTGLVTIVKELKQNDKLAVELMGYTDPTGDREYNIQLSQRRVEAVRRFLAENGVELWRIQSVGLGPILDRETPREKKRRVTVKLTMSE
jgi:outer membrane protein OmpA-like peptidoglycan-associated protein